MNYIRPVLFILLAGCLGMSCSRSKDTFTSRFYHQMTSKYNPLFNGEVAFEQGLMTLESGHEDRYTEVIALYPWGTAEQAQAIVPQMDRAIEKAAKVIREHSMMIGGEQKNRYATEAYLLLAKAHFFKRDDFKALESFNYIIQRFPRTDQALEAGIWAIRCQTRIGNEYGSRGQFDNLYKNRNLSKRMVPHVTASLAELEISLENWEAAAELLKESLEEKPDRAERIRWTYALAQVYEKQGMRNEASKTFKQVVRYHPSDYTMYLNAQLQRALNFDVFSGRVEEVYDDLEDMIDDDKNREFRDRIYYVMALLALEDENYPKAEESLKLSVQTSVENEEQKGLSYLKLAEISFRFRAYVNAQAYYDSTYTTLPKSHERFPDVERFRKSLNDLVDQIRTIETNDSLIRLAGLSESQQRTIFEEYIANLRQREQEAAEREEAREFNRALAGESEALGSGPIVGMAGGSWYFYNQSSRSSGMSGFRAKWGRRDLSDNWRRSLAGSTMSFGAPTPEVEPEQEEEDSAVAMPVEGGPQGEERYNIEAYLAQVPKSQEAIDLLNGRNQEAYMKMGSIYKDEIRDRAEAITAYKDLLRRYPESSYAPKALYALYLMYKDKGDNATASEYATELRNRFGGSEYARLLDGSGVQDEQHNKEALQDYREAYTAYERKDYQSSMNQAKAGVDKHSTSPLVAKFDLLLALTKVTIEGTEAYANHLQYVVDHHAGTQEAEMATTLLQHVDAEPEVTELPENTPYTFEAKASHKVLIILPNRATNMNELRNRISDYNKAFHKFQNLQMQNIFLDTDLQMIVISTFEEVQAALQYVEEVQKDRNVKEFLPSENMRIFAISDANYGILYREKNVELYMRFYKQNTVQ